MTVGLRVCALAALGLASAGCVTLHPWERELLVAPVMTDPVDPLEEAFDAHVLATREAMAGADPVGGASCGCD